MGAALGACVLVLAACVGACAPVTPSPSRPSGSIDAPTTTAPPSARPSAEPTPSRAPLKLSLTLLPPEFLPSSSLRSFGSEIVWTTGPDSTADIWHAEPGEAPGLVFENPRRDSFVTQVARNAAGYAFVETNDTAYGPGGWRVWYLPTGSTKPTEVDRGSSPAAGGPPGIDLDGRRLVWAGFDEPPGGSYSFLRAADVGDLAHADTILKLAIDDGLLWTPVLDGNLVWYAVIHADFEQTGVGDEFHIESIDLGSPSRERRRFAGTANDFAPAVTPGTIMWKTVQPGYSALTWGDLHVLDRATGRVRDVEIDRADSPSIGDRFAAFEEITRKRLLLYDIPDGELIDASDALPPGMTSVTSVTVAGNLLACAVAAEEAPPQVAWALLPE